MWYYAIIDAGVQILYENLRSVGSIKEKTVAGDNKNSSFSC